MVQAWRRVALGGHGCQVQAMPRDAGQTDRLVRRLRWDEIDAAWLRRLATLARDEDLHGAGLAQPPARGGDATSELLAGAGLGRARLVARRPMVVAGLGLLSPVLSAFGGTARGRALAGEGEKVAPGAVIAEIEGPATALLTSERTLLNFIQRLSGVATCTHEHVAALGGSPTRLLDTRKTTPGFRVLEKYAVGVGGGWNHRLGLYDRIMVKDNHLAADRSTRGERLAALVRQARQARPDLLVEVEVDEAGQIEPVLAAGADIVLLDNFPAHALREAVARVRAAAWCEVSGGVTLDTLPAIGALAPDFVSCGAITHGARWADIGLDWD